MRKIISVLYLFCTVSYLSTLSAQFVTITANDAVASCDDSSFCINIEVSNFDSVTGMQYSYEWDPTILQLDNYTDNLPALGIFNEDEVAAGILQFSWFSLSPPFYVNLPDGSIIAELCFVPVGLGISLVDFGPIINSTIEVTALVNGMSQIVPAIFNEGTIEVEDIDPPTIGCPADITIISSGDNVFGIAPINPMDNCGLQSVSYTMVMGGMNVGSGMNDASGEFFTSGTTTVTYTATDEAANTSSCSFDVVLTPPPVPDTILQFIPEVSINCETGTVSIDVKVTNFENMTGMQWGMRWDELVLDFVNVQDFLPAIASYNSSLESGAILFTWFSASPPFFTTLPDSTTIFTLNFDLIGNYSSPGITFEDFSMAIPILLGNLDGPMVQGVDFEFMPEMVNIIDNTPPVIVTPCPANINVPTSPGLCTAIVSWVPPTFSDNCEIDQIQISHAPGSSFPVGMTTVTYTAIDIGGNSTSCSFTITVNDQESPIINCPGQINAGTTPGQCFNNSVNIGMATGTDNCGIATITNNAPTPFPVGTTVVTWTATDVNGNTATCTQNVVISDNQNPTIICPPDVTACSSGSVVLGSPTTADNCGVASVTNNAPGTFPTGNTTVIWTVFDNAGNSATCSQLVTVDFTPPVITCPPNVTVCAPGSVVLGSPTTSDICGIASVTNNAPGTFPVGTTIVTWTATDFAGNSASCNQLVLVQDNEPPMITCPQNISLCNPGPVVLGSPIATDNCGIASVTNNAPGSFPIGTTFVTWTATDFVGNIATCIQQVTIGDMVPPMITCPADVSVCDPGAVVLGSPITSDNCGIASVTNNAPGSFPIGTTIVIWTVTDNSGNSATCNQLVTVDDNEPPMITCPADISLCSPGPVVLGSPITSDNCGIASVTNNAPGSFPNGTTTVTWIATDLAGNIATCAQLVTIGDFVPPMITCPADVSVCDPGSVVLGTPTTSDNCGIASVTNNAPGSFPGGTTTVTWTATDLAGNTATCIQLVTVGDFDPPVINCPNVDAFDAAPGTCSAIVTNNLAPVVTDCNTFTVTYNITGSTTGMGNNDATGTEFFVGTSILTYYATDIFGNTDSCSITIQVNDGQAPVIICPSNVLIFVPNGTVDTVVNNINASASDNCAVSGVTYQTTGALTTSGNGNISGTAFPPGVTIVTYYGTDPSGNIDSCSFSVNINEVLNDMLGCPLDLTVNNDPDQCSAVVNGIDPFILINPILVNSIQYTLSGATTGSGINDASGTSFNVGTTTVEYILTDNSNNMDTCSFDVTVVDDQSPEWQNCPGNITVSANLPGCMATANWGIPLPGDNCGIVQIITSFNPNDTFSLGNTAVTYIALDAADNFGSCSFLVTVVDNTPPTIVCPSDITIGASPGLCTGIAFWDPVAVSDNCDLTPTVVCNFNSGAAFPIGTTTVICTASDDFGNTNTCTFEVTVTDSSPPVVSGCPPNLTINTDQNTCQAIFSWTEPTFTDQCSNPVSVSSTHSPGDTFQVGTTTIFYIAVDATGNSVICSFNLTVIDNQAPVPVCPADITIQTSVKECGNVVSWATPVATDNCDNTVLMTPDIPPGSFFPVGVTTVTYTALDNSGNTATCSFNVTVQDLIPPQFTCPENVVIGIDGSIISDVSGAILSITPNEGCDSITIDYLVPAASDNCAIDSFELDNGLPSGAVFPVGTTTITYLATDDSGNSAACNFDIIVLPIPAVLVTINPSDTICEGQDITLSTNVTTGGAMFSWENLNTGWTDDAEQPIIPNITLADTGTYSVTVTYPSGCTTVGSADLFVVEACQVDLSSNAPLCAGEDIELFADVDTSCNVISYSWIGPGFSSNMQNPVIPEATVQNSGTYTVTVEFDGGCSITKSINVEVTLLAPPTLNSNCGQDICFGTGCLLSGTEYNPTPDAYIWEAIPSAGAGLPTNTNSNEIAVTPTLPGTYIYNYSVEINGCVSEVASVVLFVSAEPDAVQDNFDIDFEIDTEIDVTANDTFSTSIGFSISIVSGPNNGSLINNNDGTFTYLPDVGFIGTDQFIYEICYNCEVILCDNAMVTLEVTDTRDCIVPTLITPNTDGVNDELFINCLESGMYPDNELVVFNQWGHQVFKAAPYQNNWQGTYEDKDLPDGTYFFVFKLGPDAELVKGALTIFR